MHRSFVFLKIILNSKIFKSLETRKQDMVKTWYCPFYGLPTKIFLSHNFPFIEIFSLIPNPRLQRQPQGGVFCKSWKETEKYLRKGRCFYKNTAILKMNLFVGIFMNFYYRYGNILWKEGCFFKKLFLKNTSQWLLPEAYSEHCQKSKI